MPDRMPIARPLFLLSRSTSIRGAAAAIVTIVATLCGTVTPAAAGSPACSAAPLSGCHASQVPAQTRIWLHDRSLDKRDTLVWKWRRGDATSIADFGDPVNAHGYAMCLYDAQGALLFHATVPSGGTCGARPCWRQHGSGYRYRNGRAVPDGLTKVLLKAADSGKSGIIVKGRGAHLALPPLPLRPPMTAQLQEEAGQCWSATYDAKGVRLNDGKRFRAAASR